MTLKNLKIGDTGIITKLNITGDLYFRLLDMGVTPNTSIKIKKFAPLGDPILIQIRDYNLIIRKEDAEKIQVKKEK